VIERPSIRLLTYGPINLSRNNVEIEIYELSPAQNSDSFLLHTTKVFILFYANAFIVFLPQVVHEYGHGGYGVTVAPGSAKYAVNLLKESLRLRHDPSLTPEKSKL
jgi:hypothetical protein